MARKLASVQKIVDLQPITGADAIEVAQILGWKVVVKKGEFNIGDMVVYCEIDSIMPDRPEFDFLKGTDGKVKRIRTIKLRGQVSQGIAFPMDILLSEVDIKKIDGIYYYVNEELSESERYAEIGEGCDLTEIIGVEKYELPIPACLAGEAKGQFPSCVPKTDEDRIQIVEEDMKPFEGRLFYETEKLDGTSTTYLVRVNEEGVREFGACSRNIEFRDTPNNTIWKVAHHYNVPEKLLAVQRNLAIQGEMIGEGIQKNKYGLHGQDFYVFRIFDIDKYQFVPYAEAIQITKDLGLKFVPIRSTSYVLKVDVDELVNRAILKSTLNPKVWQEGTVFVLADPQNAKEDRVSFKAINPNFLLKYDDA
jgi:RNA ligase (TIGR02306 family)